MKYWLIRSRFKPLLTPAKTAGRPVATAVPKAMPIRMPTTPIKAPEQHETADQRRAGGAHRLEYGDVRSALFDRHDQGGDQVERGNAHEKGKQHEQSRLLGTDRPMQVAVGVVPGAGKEAILAQAPHRLASQRVGGVKVGEAQLIAMHLAAQSKQPLGVPPSG